VRILRHLTLGGITVLSTVVICFVAADRVTHTTLPAPAPAIVAQAAPTVAEPQTTGTVTQSADLPEKAARRLDGFDTERLNALMRGELPPPPAPVKTAARKR